MLFSMIKADESGCTRWALKTSSYLDKSRSRILNGTNETHILLQSDTTTCMNYFDREVYDVSILF